MRIHAAVLLLAACSAEAPSDPAGQPSQATSIGVESRGGQSRGTMAQSTPATNTDAAAQIMAGGFRPDGSFVHGDHIHKPGQENCPSDQSGGPVQ